MHYYQGRQPDEFDGAKAMALIYRLPNYFRYDYDTDPPKVYSSLVQFLDREGDMRGEPEEDALANRVELTTGVLADLGSFVEVSD